MKKFLSFAFLAIVAAIGFTACNDDDEPIAPIDLPNAAQSFISTYFPNVDIFKVEKDGKHSNTEYSVTFANGYEVEFDAAGEWTDVDAPAGRTIPDGIAPAFVVEYVNSYAPGDGINEISRDTRYYEVDLVSGIDLKFTLAGELVDLDV